MQTGFYLFAVGGWFPLRNAIARAINAVVLVEFGVFFYAHLFGIFTIDR